MPNRKYGNLMPLRKNVNTTIYDKIYHKRCYHVTAWLYQMPDDRLYFVLIEHAGGQILLKINIYHAEPGKLTPIDSSVLRQLETRGLKRYIDGKWARKYAPWLRAIHWNLIQPELRKPRVGFVSPHSIVLHYVWSNPAVNDPTEGMENMYGVTGRMKNAKKDTPVTDALAAMPKPSPWSAKERSLLRTLDKLLKP